MTTTISYISGGKLGDFIQQMSIIYEKFLIDGRLAILYISERGDTFRHGVQQAYTDLSPIVSRQPYIKEFKIYQGEPYEIDLSSWRQYISQSPLETYLTWMKKEYSVDWGKHKWICNIPKDSQWNDKIVINTTQYRFPDIENWFVNLRSHPKEKLVFVGFNLPDYHDFVRRTRFKIRFHNPLSLLDYTIILNSCQSFMGSLSAPLSIALSLHIPCNIGFFGSQENHFDYQVFYNMCENISGQVQHHPPTLSRTKSQLGLLKQQTITFSNNKTTIKKMPTRLQKYLKK